MDALIYVKTYVTIEGASQRKLHARERENSQSHKALKRESKRYILGGRIGCVDWLPSLECETLELKTTRQVQI